MAKKTLKDFLLVETTIPDELQYKADNYTYNHHGEVDEPTLDKMHHAMGGKTFTHFPLTTETIHGDPDVHEHLHNHGYEVSDYQKGIASKKTTVGDPSRGIPLREKIVHEKIGSILEKTKAPDHIKQAYTNDPARSKSESPMHVVISHHPMAIAGMSTGTPWYSCMNLKDGSNQRYLRDDSEHGTHTAYLVHKDDPTAFKTGLPSNPVGRINLKPYHHEDDDGEKDTIFRPEGNSYGSEAGGFRNALHKWSVEHYPAKVGKTYEINPSLYNEGAPRYHEADESQLVDAVKATSPDGNGKRLYAHLKGLTNITHPTIDKMLEANKSVGEPSSDIAKWRRNMNLEDITEHVENLSPIHVAKIANQIHQNSTDSNEGNMASSSSKEAYDMLARRHGHKFSSNELNSYLSKETGRYHDKIVANPKFPESHFDKLRLEQLANLRHNKWNQTLTDKVANSYLNGESGSSYVLSDNSHHFKGKDVEGMLKSNVTPSQISTIHKTFRKNPEQFTREAHNVALEKLSDYNRLGSTDSMKVSAEMLRNSPHTKLADLDLHPHLPKAYAHIAQNKNLSEEDSKELAKKVVEHTEQYNGASGRYNNLGTFTHMVPEHISKHFTNSDYERMANTDRLVVPENEEHHRKLLKAVFNNAKTKDEDLSNYNDEKNEEHDDYDPEEDEGAQHKQEALNKKMAHLSRIADEYVTHHIRGDDQEPIKSHYAHEYLHDMIHPDADHMGHSIHKFENYKTAGNSNRYDDTEHYDDNFSGVNDELDDLKKRQEHVDNYGHDNWD